MFTRLTAISLIFFSLAANLSSLFLFAGYELNRDYITKEFCVNKDKPELHCNGKCYLMKKLKQAEEKEQKQEKQEQKMLVQEALFPLRFVFKRYLVSERHFYIPAGTDLPKSDPVSVFHPPPAAA